MPAPREANSEELRRMRELRAGGMSWEAMAPLMGMSRYWCNEIGVRHGFGAPLGHHAARPPTVTEIRLSAGLAPLAAGHPLAMAELERAREIEL